MFTLKNWKLIELTQDISLSVKSESAILKIKEIHNLYRKLTSTTNRILINFETLSRKLNVVDSALLALDIYGSRPEDLKNIRFER
jgi:hypothetical protein